MGCTGNKLKWDGLDAWCLGVIACDFEKCPEWQEGAEMVVCPDCGAYCRSTQKFCHHCHYNLEAMGR